MSIKHFLQRHDVPFEVVTHPQSFDAQHLAQALHVPGREVAKTVLLRTDHGRRYLIAVLPSTHMIDLKELSPFLGEARLSSWPLNVRLPRDVPIANSACSRHLGRTMERKQSWTFH